MHPFEKRGHTRYCFAIVGRSVDQAMSTHYLLTSYIESCQTWYMPLGSR